MLSRFDLKNKVVLLTGGAGVYGRGLAADLAAANATLIVASRSREACAKVAGEECARGHSVAADSYDQADEDSIRQLRNRIIAQYGRIDGVVNNSVARPMRGPQAPASSWTDSMEVNATGIFLMHRYFGEAMIPQQSGSIVNIGSIQGMVGPTLSLYGSSGQAFGAPDYFFHKAGMVNLTRYYAAFYGPHGIRVNCLSPGGLTGDQPEEFKRRYSEQTFLGRLGDEEDLGGAVVFLLSDAARYITGVNLPIDGGYTAH